MKGSSLLNRFSYRFALGRSKKEITVVLVLLYPFAFIWQGFDMTDMGYWLAGYQQFENAPDVLKGTIAQWFTYFIGWCLGETFGGGVLTFRIAWAGVFSLCFYLAYLALRKQYKFSIAISSIGVAMLFVVVRKSGNWLDYNNLSVLFITTSSLMAYVAISYGSYNWLRISAFIAGASIFVRFPNVLGFGIGVCACWYFPRRKYGYYFELFQWLAFYVIGVLFVVFLIYIFGHQLAVAEGFGFISSLSTDNTKRHSINNLLRVFVFDYSKSILSGLFFSALCFYIYSKFVLFRRNLIIPVALGMALIFSAGMGSWIPWKYFANGMVLVWLLYIAVFNYRDERNVSALAVLAILVLLIIPAGSSMSVKNSPLGMVLGLPLVISWLISNKNEIRFYKFKFEASSLKFLCIAFSGALIANSVITTALYNYRDSHNRLQMIFQVSDIHARYIYTTEQRAKTISELRFELDKHVRPGQYLLAYHNIPMVHYLTNTKPWLGNFWPKVLGVNGVNQAILDNFKKNKKLPVVVQDIADVGNSNWPEKIVVPESDSVRTCLDDFVRENSYQVAWKNNSFAILLPSSGYIKNVIQCNE